MRFVISVVAAVILGAGAAAAADVPLKAPVKAAPPAPSWTGFYLGANGGGGKARSSVSYAANDIISGLFLDALPFPGAASSDVGLLGGLQAGYNYQFAPRWVAGLEADFDWADIKTTGETSFVGNNMAVSERIAWFGTLRGRLGYLPAPDLMAYVTGGVAYGRIERSGSWIGGGGGFGGGFSVWCAPGPAVCTEGSASEEKIGWALGGGLEYALGQRWSVRAEYLYIQFRGGLTETAVTTVPTDPTPSSFSADFRTGLNIVRLGLNYRF